MPEKFTLTLTFLFVQNILNWKNYFRENQKHCFNSLVWVFYWDWNV